MIRLRLSASKALWSWLLAKVMRSPFMISHVDIVLPSGELLGAHIVPGVDGMGRLVKSGVAIRDPDYGDPTFTLDVTYDADEETTAVFYQYAESLCGVPFDWTGLFYFIFPPWSRRDWTKSKGFFCSELVMYLFREVGVKGFNEWVDVQCITPRDLLLPEAARWKLCGPVS